VRILLLQNIPTSQNHFKLEFYRVRDLQLLRLTIGVILKFKSCIEHTYFRCLFGILGRPTVAVIERLTALRL